jgi:hypothetical protein
MAESNTNTGKEEEKFVTVTLGDGNTVDIPKKEIVFQNVDFSDELQGVIATQPYQTAADGSGNNNNNNNAGNSRRNSPPMPDVDVSSDVQSVREEDVTITSTSMVTEDAPAAAAADSESGRVIVSERERELKFGASAVQKWKEKRDQHKAELIEKGSKLGKKWLTKTEEGREETREIVAKASKAGHVWKEKFMETKEEEEKQKQVGLKLLEKARQKKEAAASGAAGEAKPSSTSPTEADGKKASPTGSPSKSDEESAAAAASNTKLKKAMTKVQPKVSIMKRKGAPPILSLPGESIPGSKSPSPPKSPASPAKKVMPAAASASENKRLLTTPLVSASPSPEPPDPGPGGDGVRDEKKKPEEPAKTFRPGGPQEMAGRIILSCKRGDWLTVESLLKLVPTEGLDTRLVTEGVGWTPLHFAAKDNRVHIVNDLINFGYNVNAKGKVSSAAGVLLFCSFRAADAIVLLVRTKSSVSPAHAGSLISCSFLFCLPYCVYVFTYTCFTSYSSSS